MRILFTTYSQRTHLFSMVPMAWALRAAGHDVRVACQPRFAAEITQAGLTAVPVARHDTSWHRLAEVHPDHAEPGLPAPYDTAVMQPPDMSWDAIRHGYRFMIALWHKVNNFPLIGGLVEFARRWQPDLVVWEPTTHAGAIAAEACGAAHARLLWSIDVFGVTRTNYLRMLAEQAPWDQSDPFADWIGGYARKYGVEFTESLTTGHFTIDQLPASLRMEAEGVTYLPVRYTPYGGPSVVPTWLQAQPERTRIALTLGSTATDQFTGYAFDLGDILRELATLDVEVVATIAESEQPKLGRLPGNVRLVSYVPLDALAATCAVVINHTGPGTFLTTARHGVPQLHLPWDFDEPELADRSARVGGSLMLHAHEVTATVVRDRVRRLLHEPRFRQGAQRLRTDILALPSPHELVGPIEELTIRHRAAALGGRP
jgi:glycosyltransferase (activator-dependent family)